MNKGMSLIVGIGVLGLFVFGAVLKRCDNKKIQEITNETLKPGEKEAIIIDTDKGTVTTISGNGSGLSGSEQLPVVGVVKGARDVRISVDRMGRLSVLLRTKGFCFEPGLSFGGADTLRAGFDVQWAFNKQFGLLSGISTRLDKTNPKLSIYTGVNYLLPWKYTSNTSVFVSYDTRKEIYFGVRVKL